MPDSDHTLLIRIDERLSHLHDEFDSMHKRLFGPNGDGCLTGLDRRVGKLENLKPYFGKLIGVGLVALGLLFGGLGRQLAAWVGGG